MIEITSEIPVPKLRVRRITKEIKQMLIDMPVGASFLADEAMFYCIRALSPRYGMKFTRQKEGTGFRIWKVAVNSNGD